MRIEGLLSTAPPPTQEERPEPPHEGLVAARAELQAAQVAFDQAARRVAEAQAALSRFEDETPSPPLPTPGTPVVPRPNAAKLERHLTGVRANNQNARIAAFEVLQYLNYHPQARLSSRGYERSAGEAFEILAAVGKKAVKVSHRHGEGETLVEVSNCTALVEWWLSKGHRCFGPIPQPA